MDIAQKLEESRRIKEIKKYLNTVRITNETFKKLNMYHKIIRDIIGTPYEVACFLLTSPHREDNITQDAFLIRNQEIKQLAGGNHNLARNYPLIKEIGMNVLGLWHSHASAGVFHSDEDMTNLRGIYTSNRSSLPNYLHVGNYHNLFSKDDFTARREGDNLIIEKNIDPYVKASELRHSIPSRISFELKEGIDDRMAEMLEKYFRDAVGGITFPLEKGLCYINSIVTNETTARQLERANDQPAEPPACSLRALVQEAPFSDNYIELGDDQLSLELVDETNGITLDEKVLRDEIYDCVNVDGMPIKDYADSRKSGIFDMGREDGKKRESIVDKITPYSDKRLPEDTEEDVSREQVTDPLVLLENLGYNSGKINLVRKAKEVIDGDESYDENLDVLWDGCYNAKNLLNTVKGDISHGEAESVENLEPAAAYLEDIAGRLGNACKEGRERKFPSSSAPISYEKMEEMKDPGGGYSPQKPSDSLPKGVGKKNEEVNINCNSNKDLVEEIKKDRARRKRSAASQEESPLEREVSLLRQENQELRSRIDVLEVELDRYMSLEYSCQQLESILQDMKQQQETMYNRMWGRFDNLERTLENLSTRDTGSVNTPVVDPQTTTLAEILSPVCQQGRDSYEFPDAPISYDRGDNGFRPPSRTDYSGLLGSVGDKLSEYYSRIASSVGEGISRCRNVMGGGYSALKSTLNRGKKAFAVGLLIGAISFTSLMGWYKTQQNNAPVTPSTVAALQYDDSAAGPQSEEGGDALNKESHVQPYRVHVVENGETLWDITKNYLGSEDMDPSNSRIYLKTDELAQLNGKGKQADYEVGNCRVNGEWNEKNPHCIMPGDELKVWD